MARYETFCDRIVLEEEFHDTQLAKFQDAVSRVMYERYVLISCFFMGLLGGEGRRRERADTYKSTGHCCILTEIGCIHLFIDESF